jgi:penicillin-binding protein 1A
VTKFVASLRNAHEVGTERWADLVAALKARKRQIATVALGLIAIPYLAAATLVHRVYFDRSGLPDLEAFTRFEPPAIGEVKDKKGAVLIELAREYRRVVAYEDVPPVVRDAILSAEDKRFFSHSGIEYRALPRVFAKTAFNTLSAWWEGAPGSRVRLPQGGSTLTQQLVRGYFLQEQTLKENGGKLISNGWVPRVSSWIFGVRATNKVCRKLEEIRLSLWLEEEMRRRYGSKALAKQQIFSRYASFIYMGHGRYGLAAASEYYFRKSLSSYTDADAGRAALLAGIPKSPRDYAPDVPGPRPARRRNLILALMVRNGHISKETAELSRAEKITVTAPRAVETDAPAVIDAVFDELRAHGGDKFNVQDLVDGRIAVQATVDAGVQTIVNEALENGLALYEKRHPSSKGLIQGSVVVLRNSDAAILAETGGRRVYRSQNNRYSDLNRVTGSLRQPGSVWKPLVYLTAFRRGLNLDSIVPDEPIAVRMGDGGIKWIANYDRQFKGLIPLRQALAESRNGCAVWLARGVGLEEMIRTARLLGIRSPIQPFITTALGASEVRLIELANVYRAMASGILAEPHVVDRVTNRAGSVVYEASRETRDLQAAGVSREELSQLQEGLRSVVRLSSGTAHALDSPDFPIPVMGKTGTTSEFRDALFVGSTYGASGITVAVRIGFDDNRSLGDKETGGRSALPIFREVMLRAYKDKLVGPVPRFPRQVEQGIDDYIAMLALPPPVEVVAPALEVIGVGPGLR